MQTLTWEHVQTRLWRWRRNQNWLRLKALFLPNVVIVSHHRSGYQWFRQICDANLPVPMQGKRGGRQRGRHLTPRSRAWSGA